MNYEFIKQAAQALAKIDDSVKGLMARANKLTEDAVEEESKYTRGMMRGEARGILAALDALGISVTTVYDYGAGVIRYELG